MQLQLFRHRKLIELNYIFNDIIPCLYLRLDIWDSNNASLPDTRSGVIGTAPISGICSPYQYSIMEFSGLNSIQNAAHELGHKLNYSFKVLKKIINHLISVLVLSMMELEQQPHALHQLIT